MPPASTYRLQIRPGFTLDEAAGHLAYLAELGVGAVYLSPVLASTTGSDHGYDTTDPTRIDPQRGGEDGWRVLVDQARRLGLQVVVDIVPNHLGISRPDENPAWWDVLRHGRSSRYARWFDIAWDEDGRFALPILGQRPVAFDAETVRIGQELLPLAPGTGGGRPDEVLARQHYRLTDVHHRNEEIGYRRFFAVTTLAGVRQEDEEVFAATHVRVARWIADGDVDAVRVDHPDGLADPLAYLRRLRDLVGDRWLLVEKILEPGEDLPGSWPVEGTTGYDAARDVGLLLIDERAEAEATERYRRLTGDDFDLDDHLRTSKRMIADTLFGAERTRIAALLGDVPHARDALAELATAFAVYRSYVPEGADHLRDAVALASRRRPDLAGALQTIGRVAVDPSTEVAVRVQQLTGAVMAKGVEDTAYYRYARFIAENEVGGDPAAFGLSLDDFHAAMARRQRTAAASMTALSTHDTKRGEDVRARQAVLAEVGAEWERFARLVLDAAGFDDRPLAYLLAQTVVGTGRIDPDRLHRYATKAMREAAVHTTWDEQDAGFEDSVHALIDALHTDRELTAAWDRIDAVVTGPGRTNSLTQKLVQLMMPGVPDIYQGTEVWENSLVDPDNRRPVDFAAIADRLAGLTSAPPVDDTGAAKLWLVRHALHVRRQHDLDGYTPLGLDDPADPASRHLVGFARGEVLVVATRLPVGLERLGGWGAAAVDVGARTDVLTGRVHHGSTAVSSLLSTYPVALLV